MTTWALVPVVALRHIQAGQPSYAAMLTASPGADLLERIVRARDRLELVKSGRDYGVCDVVEAIDELLAALDELGGSNG